jgi:hypothetical protein
MALLEVFESRRYRVIIGVPSRTVWTSAVKGRSVLESRMTKCRAPRSVCGNSVEDIHRQPVESNVPGIVGGVGLIFTRISKASLFQSSFK